MFKPQKDIKARNSARQKQLFLFMKVVFKDESHSRVSSLYEFQLQMNVQYQHPHNQCIFTNKKYIQTKSRQDSHIQKQYTNCNNVRMYTDQETHVEKNFCRLTQANPQCTQILKWFLLALAAPTPVTTENETIKLTMTGKNPS